MRERFFLILSCSGGAGHIRAGEALLQAAESTKYPIRAEHHDVLDYTSTTFKRLYARSYLNIVNHAPEAWGYLYQLSDKTPFEKKGMLKLFDHFNYRRYLRELARLKPDAIVCTHYLPYMSVSERLSRGSWTIPFFAATTDFDVHRFWVDPFVARYYVFHDESASQLESAGVSSDRIRVKGIPVLPPFRVRRNASTLRRALDLNPRSTTILVVSGGFGVGRVEEIVGAVSDALARRTEQRYNLLVVCGRNERVRSRIGERQFPPNIAPKVFGFVDNIDELMGASDVLVSKAGGLTCAEAMAMSLPMLVVDPIPGQEARNADLIVEHGAGWKAVSPANLTYKLGRLLSEPLLMRRARRGAGSLGRPDAAPAILEDVYRACSTTGGTA